MTRARSFWFTAIAILAALVSTTPSGAASSPTVRVGPHNGLVAGETVTVHWSGFHDHATRFIIIYECRPNFDEIGWNACTSRYGDTTRGRRGSRTIEVATGTIGLGDGTCGTSRTDRDCLIVVRAVRANGIGGSYADAPIRFAAPH